VAEKYSQIWKDCSEEVETTYQIRSTKRTNMENMCSGSQNCYCKSNRKKKM